MIQRIPVASKPPLHVCLYYISVYGYTASTYTVGGLVGPSSSAADIVLLKNTKVAGAVFKGQLDYYVFVLTPTVLANQTTITVTVNPIVGDPDLYISLTTIHPNDIDYQWDSTSVGIEQITIDLGKDDQACSPLINEDGVCAYYIGVFGWIDSQYSMLATVGNTAIPLEKIPQRGQSHKKYQTVEKQ